MNVLAAAAVTVALLLSRRGRRARLRWRRRGGAPPAGSARGRMLVALPVAAIGALMAVVSTGTPAVVATVVVASGLLVRRRRRDRTRVRPGDLALAVDVLGGCLASGASMPAALAAAGVAAPDEVAAELGAASMALSRGEDPATTWSSVETRAPELAVVARLCSRAAITGAATADELRRIAVSLRAAGNVSRRGRLQRAAVWLVLPLGLCFLPAFVVVGVVPLIVATLPGLTH